MLKLYVQRSLLLYWLSLLLVSLSLSSCASTMNLQRNSAKRMKTDVSQIETRSVTDSLRLTGTRTVRIHQVVENYQRDSATGQTFVINRVITDVDQNDEQEQTQVSKADEDTLTDEETEDEESAQTKTDVKVEETFLTNVSKGIKVGLILGIVLFFAIVAYKRK